MAVFGVLLIASWVSSLPSIRYVEQKPGLLLIDSPASYLASGAHEIGESGHAIEATGALRFIAPEARQLVVRWQLDLPPRSDRIRVTARLDVGEIEGPGSQDPLVSFVLRQWDRKRFDSYLLAGLAASGSGVSIERLARVWRPDHPFVLELRVTSDSGGIQLHELRVDALCSRSGVVAVQVVLLVAWLGLFLVTWMWLSRRASRLGRVILWSVLVLLLAGMLAPAELIQWAKAWIAPWLGLFSDGSGVDNVAAVAHFVSFGVLAAVLLQVRRDLGRNWLMGILACIAVATEFMQMLVDNRHADAVDVLVNLAGILVAAILVWAWWGRRSSLVSVKEASRQPAGRKSAASSGETRGREP